MTQTNQHMVFYAIHIHSMVQKISLIISAPLEKSIKYCIIGYVINECLLLHQA